MNTEIATYIGYAASFFVVGGFIMKDLRKIRLVNLIGCICFVVYGAFNIPVLWPVIIPNGILCLIQLYHLIRKP